MAHLPLHGIQTKAQRLSTLAHEVSLAGGHSAWIYRLSESPTPVPVPSGSRLPFGSRLAAGNRLPSPLSQQAPKN